MDRSGARLRAELRSAFIDGSAWTYELSEPFSHRWAAKVWMSNGSTLPRHPAKTYPYTLEVSVPPLATRVSIVGIFALYCEGVHEGLGTRGASLQFLHETNIVQRVDLVNGRHYAPASDLELELPPTGDGCAVHRVGTLYHPEGSVRIDELVVDILADVQPQKLLLRDLGSSASFCVASIEFDVAPAARCPFHSHSGGVSLSDLPAIVRIRDRSKFGQARDQLVQSLRKTQDLDDARGEALTFLAVITAGLLEAGGARELHRAQLDAARRFEQARHIDELTQFVLAEVEQLAGDLLEPEDISHPRLIQRAIETIERNFARDLSDIDIASQLGLSTSHFRFLFRQATGQPFHKYLVATRLERAREMLAQGDVPVSDVAVAVGFHGVAHFSRAFAARFHASPTEYRRARR